jgi:hypothetical protein
MKIYFSVHALVSIDDVTYQPQNADITYDTKHLACSWTAWAGLAALAAWAALILNH